MSSVVRTQRQRLYRIQEVNATRKYTWVFRKLWYKYIYIYIYMYKCACVLCVQYHILQGLQQKLQKSRSRYNKNTWHVEWSYMLQSPKYLLLFGNRFRYINNNVTKDRCSILMDTTVRLGPLKFSLRATIDHHGPSLHSGHYTASINYCKKHSIATITQ